MGDISLCLKTNWRRVGIKKQKKISFRAESSAKWKMTFIDREIQYDKTFLLFVFEVPGEKISKHS